MADETQMQETDGQKPEPECDTSRKVESWTIKTMTMQKIKHRTTQTIKSRE